MPDIRHKKTRGAALVTTLATIAIVSLVAATVAALSVRHLNRSYTDQYAAKAHDMAECAAQFQLQRLMATMETVPVAYNGTNVETATYGTQANPLPITGKLYTSALGPGNAPLTAGNLNTFLSLNTSSATPDYCRAWIEYPGLPTEPFSYFKNESVYIYGEARVNGVWRRVRVAAGGGGLFDKWAVFGHTIVQIGGSFSVTPTTGSYRAFVASNTLIDIQKPGAIGGQVVYGLGVPESSLPYVWGGPTYELPTITELATRAYADGNYPVSLSLGILKFAGLTAASTNNDNYALGRYEASKNTLVRLPATGNVDQYPIYLVGKGATTPANYYLTKLDGSNVKIYANVSNGPINLWVNRSGQVDDELGSSTGETDQLTGNVEIIGYTTVSNGVPVPDLNATRKFHIYYYNRNGTLRIRGGGSADGIWAMLYAFNRTSSGVPNGTIEVAGSVIVNGAVATNIITGNGNFTVNYPQYVGAVDYGGTYFGQQGSFQEVTPVRGN